MTRGTTFLIGFLPPLLFKGGHQNGGAILHVSLTVCKFDVCTGGGWVLVEDDHRNIQWRPVSSCQPKIFKGAMKTNNKFGLSERLLYLGNNGTNFMANFERIMEMCY